MKVEWTSSALDRLADMFVSADLAEQHVLEAEVIRINVALAGSPWHLGESRSSGRRVWFNDRLVVVFRVFDDELVVVSHVGRLRSK